MKDYRWFKIVVRAIGLLLVAQSIPFATSAVEAVISAMQPRGPYPVGSYWAHAATVGAGAVGQALLGLYLLSGAPKFVRYCIDQAERRCIRCDYDLTGLTGVCPECGLPIPVPMSPPSPSQA